MATGGILCLGFCMTFADLRSLSSLDLANHAPNIIQWHHAKNPAV